MTFSPKRLFIGIELPPGCKATLLALDPHIRGLRWLAENQLHLTLSFLGTIDASGEKRLREALSAVQVPPFVLPLRGVGAFNVRGRPSVVWVGVGKGHPHLFALHHHVQDAVLQAGLEPDLKPFHPHVTVARTKTVSRQMLQPFLRRHADAEVAMFKVNGFALYSSVLAAEGAMHFIEMRQEF